MTLGKLTDDLTDALAAAEQALVRLDLGVSAEVYLDPEDGAEGRLAFRKAGGAWQLLIVPPGGAEIIPLASASRRRRVLAAQRLDALLEALLAEEAEQREPVRYATRIALDFAERLGRR